MVISYRYRVMFFHCPKTAGVSIKNALRKLHEEDTPQFKPHNPKLNLHWVVVKKEHISIYKYIHRGTWTDFDAQLWQDYYKFAVVRNPWDRAYSMYHFFGHKSQDEQNADFLELYPTFEGWLERLLEHHRWGREYHIGTENQHEYTHYRGEQVVNQILRFETLDKDWRKVCDWMGVEWEPLPHRNVAATRERGYHQYYNDKTAATVAEIFAKDIELFGYEFG